MTKNESITRARKIRIFPTTKQKSFFKKCFGATRFIYNKTLDAIKNISSTEKRRFKNMAKKSCIHIVRKKQTKLNGGSKTKNVSVQCCNKLSTKYYCSKHKKCKPKYEVTLNFQYWRNLIIKKNSEIPKTEYWLKEIPYDTRQLVVKNVLSNYKSAISNRVNVNIKKIDIKFKSNSNQFFFLDHRAIKDNGILWPKIINEKS